MAVGHEERFVSASPLVLERHGMRRFTSDKKEMRAHEKLEVFGAAAEGRKWHSPTAVVAGLGA